MKLRSHSKKKQIKVAIETFFGMLRPGDVIRSEELVKACKRHMGIKYIYPDTLLRYLRQMRSDEVLNYTCVHKEKRIFKIIEIGEPHSL